MVNKKYYAPLNSPLGAGGMEQQRLNETNSSNHLVDWKKWGSYVSERQWGTVREDYSANGDAWNYTTHDMSRSKAYRWGEEGIAGICDNEQLLCFSIALWNKKDSIIKETLFGLSNPQGNHGEDVKELYYYLDATPTHSYMKMLYKYPQNEFPYKWLVDENAKRNKLQPEFEILDTGIFNNNEYFDVFVEYAKASASDVLIKITVHNRSEKDAQLNVLPTVWFRNVWSWGYDDEKPVMHISNNNKNIHIHHKALGDYNLYVKDDAEILFCENETNNQRLYNSANASAYTKDGVNEYIIHKNNNAINEDEGTKAVINLDTTIPSKQNKIFVLRLCENENAKPFNDFENIFQQRINEANAFYENMQQGLSDDEKNVQRQAFAGMLWNKQFYYYNISQWLNGDPSQPKPPAQRCKGRNNDWRNLNNYDIISMPDKWEYPWYALWDLAFHCVTFALLDVGFAKKQLKLLTHEWYMHPNGELPAYEWSFSDVNPPVHAWATWRVYEIDKNKNNGKGDIPFLETVFHKLLINFTWWVNQKDKENNNIFEGGFLGLDNIGVFDRSKPLPGGAFVEEADATAWMAMYALNLMRIALELAMYNPIYQDLATKFFEHFLYIADSAANMGHQENGLWDDEDQFFYDVLKLPDGSAQRLKLRSMVGIIPLFAVEVIEHECLEQLPKFAEKLNWFLDNKPELADLVSRWQEQGVTKKHLLSLLRGHRMKMILKRMLDENEFLSDYGVRALSKVYKENPFEINVDGEVSTVKYTPAESDTDIFAGNSNWRGPVWMSANFLIIESLERFHYYYSDDFKVECPTNSGNYLSLLEIAQFLTKRLTNIFLLNEEGKRAVFGEYDKLQHDEHFKNHILFYEYFHGDNGRGVGASHQTGWTGLIAKLFENLTQEKNDER